MTHLRFLLDDPPPPATAGGTELPGEMPGTAPRPSAERSRPRGSGDAVPRRDDGHRDSGEGRCRRALDAATRSSCRVQRSGCTYAGVDHSTAFATPCTRGLQAGDVRRSWSASMYASATHCWKAKPFWADGSVRAGC